jgi:hypothetical protein
MPVLSRRVIKRPYVNAANIHFAICHLRSAMPLPAHQIRPDLHHYPLRHRKQPHEPGGNLRLELLLTPPKNPSHLVFRYRHRMPPRFLLSLQVISGLLLIGQPAAV